MAGQWRPRGINKPWNNSCDFFAPTKTRETSLTLLSDERKRIAGQERDRRGHSVSAVLNASTALRPPNAKEFDRQASTDNLRRWFGITSRSHAGSGEVKFAVGGSIPSLSANMVAAASRAPAAPSACPCIDFVELTASRSACVPKT